jgi:hypothetical protein
MSVDDSIPPKAADAPAPAHQPDPDYPHIPYPIIRPAQGSPYFIDPVTGWKSRLLPPGHPPLTSEYVRKMLEDFP